MPKLSVAGRAPAPDDPFRAGKEAGNHRGQSLDDLEVGPSDPSLSWEEHWDRPALVVRGGPDESGGDD